MQIKHNCRAVYYCCDEPIFEFDISQNLLANSAQSTMKLHGNACVYISEKFWDMSVMDKQEVVLAYEKFGYLTIPDLIVL